MQQLTTSRQRGLHVRITITYQLQISKTNILLTLKVPEKLPHYGLYVQYVVHICNFGMLRVNVCLQNTAEVLV